jgi:CheY-like chemotaxis protein
MSSILVVDDEQIIANTVSIILEREGHLVTIAPSKQTALQSAAGIHPLDLLIINHQLRSAPTLARTSPSASYQPTPKQR